MWEKSARDKRGQRARPTVDGNGHTLVQNVTVLALKSRDLAQLVELQVLGGGLGGVDLDDVELEIVGLRDGANGRAPGVVLRQLLSMEFNLSSSEMFKEALPRMCRACRKPLLRIYRLHNCEMVVLSQRRGRSLARLLRNFASAGFGRNGLSSLGHGAGS